MHLKRLTVIALSLADLAGNIDIGEKMHLDLDDAVALTGLAAAALDIEGEAPGTEAAPLGFLRLGEQVADIIEHAGIGGGVGARRAADGRLIDVR